MKLTYQLIAGKFDDRDHERNIKYINGFNTLEEAFDAVFAKNLYTYPFCEIEVHGSVPGHKYIIDCTTPQKIKLGA